MTTINVYHLDSIKDDNKLQYNFKNNYDFEKPTILENLSLNTDYYRRVVINRDDKNITYKNEVYTFNGFYISKYSDIITDFNSEDNNNYYLIIETRNIATLNNRSYLYLYIPIENKTEDKSDFGYFINGFANKSEHIVHSYNFNDLIPAGNFVYYTKDNIIINSNKRSIDNIIFRSSNLTADLNKLIINSKVPTKNKINNPLLLNNGPAVQTEYITGQIDNDIYIDCSPVEEVNPEEEYIIPTNKKTTINMKYSAYFIVIIAIISILLFIEYFTYT
tara:strand:- start:257 stop:1084 length:828 start_codon:yes stop_codon:yes gene_type:complete